MTIHLLQKAQIAALKQDEALIKVLAKYSDFWNVFLEKEALVLPKQTNLNEHAIKLKKDKQLPYKWIYSLGLIELKILKTYIKTHLKTGFIWPSKSPADAFILLSKKPNGSLWLCIDYWDLNNLIIKNQYPLPLISELFDRLSQAKQFI